MVKRIIATIVTSANERHWPDFEIPAELPVRQAAALVADSLRGEVWNAEHIHFYLERKIADGEWKPLDENRSLLEQEISDGAYLRVQKSLSTTPGDKPLDGWRSIFDTYVQFDHGLAEEEEEPVQGYVWKLLK